MQRGKYGRRSNLGLLELLAGRENAAAKAAILRFHVSETRQHRTHTKFRGGATVDSGEHRVGDSINHFGAVVALNQSCDAFIANSLARRKSPLAHHTEFRGGEKSGDSKAGAILVGTMNISPSGMGDSLPFTKM